MTETTTEAVHPARAASRRSMEAVKAKNKQEWLSLFADDGWVEDPVGKSGFDPEGKGHHGKEAIAAFWDMAIANTDTIEFLIDDSFACGDEVVNVGTIRTTLAGNVIDAEGVFTYRVTTEGKIQSLRAFWEIDRAMKTVRPA
ncbi:nuclear transport factor 2 family protein [Rhodococcus sp. D2-41]|uniref:Nuclear transport factor 2 family protein n=1 Tax=Speluncibacter jeojiensis TaxID=2710754 RepID=A0A9X4M179_9ACTN|nr:nuclear transport factor 2 family protein [Rhodococcus sp. D2-41]MDG3011499.1 nuclear transport factor 2 family protein [Rhodococcus sp. D2-41]MDG3015145.1 nuclear transport factor 2 family protein [Corynebacteriales bacterium D3-21]